MMKANYTKPKIITANSNDWYVYFRFFHLGKWHPRKYREDLNRIKDLGERKREAEALLEAREIWLAAGWNPVADPKFKARSFKASNSKKEMFFNDAIDYAFSKKTHLKKKSIADYRNILGFIKTTAAASGFSYLQMSAIDRGILLDLLDECSRIRKFSNHAYNKHADCLRSMLTTLVDYRIIDVNPLRDLKDKEVPESNKYAPYTDSEKKQIADHLKKVHPRLFVVMSVIYHTGIRNKETLSLKVKDIDLNNRIITIAPDMDANNSKTNSVRRIPINSHLFFLLKAMKLEKYPGEFFAFGSPRISPKNGGAGEKSINSMDQRYFTPSPVEVKRDTLTRLWEKLIIKGLGINKYLYAAKHTGADDKVDAGLELSEIQILFGHKSEAMTERYNKRKRENSANKSLLDKSPSFN